MGKATRKKQEAELARQPNFSTILLKSVQVETKKRADILAFDPLNIIKGFEEYAIRPLENFVPRTRSLNITTRGREFIRYAFNKYSPPGFLYSVWHEKDQAINTNLFGIKEDFRLWYLALVQGRSLYKECSMGILTKRETFYFSTCIHSFTISKAIWYCIIRCFNETAPDFVARKIASTTISSHSVNEFWKGVARWFAKYNPSIKIMNELMDYINTRHQENHEWYLKDQTLNSMQKAMYSWHREMHRSRTMIRQYEKWDGINVQDSQIERGGGRNKVHWRFHQIKTGNELAQEGSKQHHCVSIYGSRCHSGQCSIWSLTTDEKGIVSRALTIEVNNNDKAVVQARGYANRLPRTEELSVLREWAAKCGFRVKGVV